MTEWVPQTRILGRYLVGEKGFEQVFSSFFSQKFAIFDYFSKFLSTFGTHHQESNMTKHFGKNEEKPSSTRLTFLNPGWFWVLLPNVFYFKVWRSKVGGLILNFYPSGEVVRHQITNLFWNVIVSVVKRQLKNSHHLYHCWQLQQNFRRSSKFQI